MSSYGRSDIGLVRNANEDCFYTDEAAGIYVLADGMGGYVAGEVASSTAVQAVKQQLTILPYKEESIRTAMQAANTAILQKIQEQPELAGMGTTLTVLWKNGNNAYWGHVGDSRLYTLEKSVLTQITTDHSLIQRWVQEGILSPEEAVNHPKRNILTRAIGVEDSPVIDTGSISLKNTDKLLLCSDGLHSLVPHETIQDILKQGKSDRTLTDELIEAAYQQGAKDNITVIIITLRAGIHI